MNPKAEEFLLQLEQLCPNTNDYLVADLYEITERLKADSTTPELFEAIFRFFEIHPDVDFGVPGPLVHLIEQHRGSYETLLVESVARAPVPTTLCMVNRILNAEPRTAEREKWLSILAGVKTDTSHREDVQALAAMYLELQDAKG